MKYMLMFVQTDEEAWEKLTPAQQNMPAIERWWAEQAQSGRLVGGHQLRSSRTATTVRWNGGRPVVTDGPFIEALASFTSTTFTLTVCIDRCRWGAAMRWIHPRTQRPNQIGDS